MYIFPKRAFVKGIKSLYGKLYETVYLSLIANEEIESSFQIKKIGSYHKGTFNNRFIYKSAS